jgi:hypothetical protein
MCYAEKGQTALRGHKELIGWKLFERAFDILRTRRVAK